MALARWIYTTTTMNKAKGVICTFLLGFTLCQPATLAFGDSTTQRPNIVLILADDVALMDFGVYGGEAATPNIDKLANHGTLFTNHHASPMCAPSRAMLMTGYDSHLTGVPNLPLFLPPEYTGKPGYSGVLNDKVKTVATRLKNNGYHTFMTGKWHLGHTPTSLPSQRGFDRTFILNASGADNYEHKAYLPTQSKPPWYEDGQEIDLPDDFYSSRNLVDKMIEFMEEAPEDDDPFFSFLSFQAIHIPVQAPKEFVDKYIGVYEKGWSELRQKRFERAKELGLIPATSSLGEMLPFLLTWDALSPEDKKMKANAMAVNAAMLEAMDFHIGRYMDYLEQKGKLDNTVFIITSDNGPEGSDAVQVTGMGLWMQSVGYHRDNERLGQKGYFGFIGPEFASAAAGPSAFFKFYAGEGGLRTPLIFSGPGIPVGQKKQAFSFITDITPSILDIAGIEISPHTSDLPLTGKSLYPVLQNQEERVYQADESIGMEAAAQAALFRGDMKLVRNGNPYGDGVWRLYNLKNDPGETKDLASTYPELFEEMMNDYTDYCVKYCVLVMPKDYDVYKEIQYKFLRKLRDNGWPWMLGIGLLLVFFLIRRRRYNHA